ncbi:lysozyme inhibitor LprI family protein [Lysobacter firmicutimachus]|uniref:Lysozyme inhibitor LprI family protein n=1 Tax=Lysobacter firmicutimachus TaxID=1792846 RepID=A0AAU8MUD2_9GAMM|nr:lysozyme inhibitor LprI family protein [Lysobacter antibioticus]
MNAIHRCGLAALLALTAACQAQAPANEAATPAPVAAPATQPEAVPTPAVPEAVAQAPAPEAAPKENSTDKEASMFRESYSKCAEATNGVTFEIQACIEQEFEYQDGRLNAAYKRLQALLPTADMSVLRDAQRKWIAEKDKACAWDAETEGQAQRIEANSCALKMTAERAVELEAMIARQR